MNTGKKTHPNRTTSPFTRLGQITIQAEIHSIASLHEVADAITQHDGMLRTALTGHNDGSPVSLSTLWPTDGELQFVVRTSAETGDTVVGMNWEA